MDYIVLADTDFGPLAAYALDVTDLGTTLVRADILPGGTPDWGSQHEVTDQTPAMDRVRDLLETLALAAR